MGGEYEAGVVMPVVVGAGVAGASSKREKSILGSEFS